MKHKLILHVSARMSSNKMQDRKEHSLIRMGAKARKYLNLQDEPRVELWPDTNITGRINKSKMVTIFKAYSNELKDIKRQCKDEDEFLRSCFVTKRTFEYICGNAKDVSNSIWLADTIEDTVIGSDPEFMLIDGHDRLVRGENIIEYYGELGSDGPLVELRPPPVVNVHDITKHIFRLLSTGSNAEKISDYNCIAGCFNKGEAIGGHIHVGTPSHMNSQTGEFKHKVFVSIARILDEYIAIPMLKLDEIAQTKSRRCEYGYVGDIREEHGRLEYRVLSGTWLAHPAIIGALFGSIKTVTDSIFKFIEDVNYNEDKIFNGLLGDYMDYNDYVEWEKLPLMHEFKVTMSNKELECRINKCKNIDELDTRAYITSLKNKFERLSGYNNFKSEVSNFIDIISLPAEVLRSHNVNLKETWLEKKDFVGGIKYAE